MSDYMQMLRERCRREIQTHGNAYKAGLAWGINSSHFTRVLRDGEDSPKLRRKFGIRKTNRVRLNIDTVREVIDLFDGRRGHLSREAYLLRLMEIEDDC